MQRQDCAIEIYRSEVRNNVNNIISIQARAHVLYDQIRKWRLVKVNLGTSGKKRTRDRGFFGIVAPTPHPAFVRTEKIIRQSKKLPAIHISHS